MVLVVVKTREEIGKWNCLVNSVTMKMLGHLVTMPSPVGEARVRGFPYMRRKVATCVCARALFIATWRLLHTIVAS